MPSPTELAIIFLLGLAANAVWRYVGRGLDRFELRAGQTLPQLRVAAGRQHSFVWLAFLALPAFLGVLIWAATKGWWAAIGAGFGGLLAGFSIGVALNEAQRRAWIPAGIEHIVAGLLMLLLAGLLARHLALEVTPWFGFAAVGIAPLALIELWMGVRMLRAKAQAHDT